MLKGLALCIKKGPEHRAAIRRCEKFSKFSHVLYSGAPIYRAGRRQAWRHTPAARPAASWAAAH
jgi:hypothetical protein